MERARYEGHGMKETTRRNEGHAGHAGRQEWESEGDLVLPGQRCVWLQLRVSCFDDYAILRTEYGLWPFLLLFQSGIKGVLFQGKREEKRGPETCAGQCAVGRCGGRKGQGTNKLGRSCSTTAGKGLITWLRFRSHSQASPFLPSLSSQSLFLRWGGFGGKSERRGG